MILYSGGGKPLLMELPMMWRVLRQPGPPGHERRGGQSDRLITVGRSPFLGDHPLTFSKEKQNSH